MNDYCLFTHTHTHTYIYIYIYLPTPLHEQNVLQGQFFKQSLTALNSKFSFKVSCHTKVKEPCLSYYLLIDGGRIVGC